MGIITFYNYNDHTNPLFKNLTLLNFLNFYFDIIRYLCMTLAQVTYYSGRIWRLRVIKSRWFVFSRRRCHTLPILLAARFAGKMADACPVCLYKQETSSRGITTILLLTKIVVECMFLWDG